MSNEILIMPHEASKHVAATIASWAWRAKRLGLTLQDLGRALEMGDTMIYEYTSGRTMPSAVRFFEIELAIVAMEKSRGLDGSAV